MTPMLRLLACSLLVLALAGTAGCGRKGALEPPPGAPPAEEEPAGQDDWGDDFDEDWGPDFPESRK